LTRRIVAAALWSVCSLLHAAAAGAEPQPAAGGPFSLTIFHTNDIHGAFATAPPRGQAPRLGGFVPLAGHLARERADAGPSLLVDAGDVMTGNPLCELEIHGLRGGALVELMAAVGYDAGTVGNHEFDVGRAAAQALVREFPYPIIAADLVDQVDGRPLFPTGPLEFERSGLRIGLMGVSCAGLVDVCTPGRLAGAVSRDQEARLREQLGDLVEHTDVQVLISHNGVERDRALARALAGDGLDVIVGGHSHTRLAEPLLESGVIIVQAGSNLRHLGRLDLRLAEGRVTHYRGRLIALTPDVAGDAPLALQRLCAEYERRVGEVYGREIGRLATELRNDSRREGLLGDWLCDVLRQHARADVCLVNSGGIRKNLGAGPVTLLDIHEVFPFGNTLVVHSMSGASLREIIAANAAAAANWSYGILQVSGVAYRHRGEEVLEISVGGEPLDDTAVYEVAMPDFVSGMGRTYLAGADLGPVRETGETLTDIVIAAVERAKGPIRAPEPGRIVAETD